MYLLENALLIIYLNKIILYPTISFSKQINFNYKVFIILLAIFTICGFIYLSFGATSVV